MIQNKRYILDGQQIDAPLDWRGVRVVADFVSNVQPKLNVESLTFVNETLTPILKHIEEGRIFEGIDLQIEVQDEENNLTVFEGLLDPSTLKQITPNKAEFNIIEKNGLDTINERLEGITSLLLYDKGYLRNQTDVRFAVEPKQDFLYVVTTLVTIFLLTKTLQESVKDTAEDVATGSGIFSAGATGSIGATIYTVASAIFTLTYNAIIVIALVNLVKDLISKFIQPIRTHKGISWLQVLEDCSDFLGYKFNSPIKELENIIQVPNNQTELNQVINGIPKVNDYGYNMQDFFNQVLTHFNSQIAVINGVIEMHPVWSDFWLKNSTYQLPETAQAKDSFEYNTSELLRSRELVYSFDISDEYTANEEYRVQGGGVIEQGIEGCKDLLKGLESNRIFHALGSRKNELTNLEKIIKDLAKLTDSVVNTLGGSSNLSSKVLNRVGVMRVSTANHSLSKLVYIKSGSMPRNHGEILNARNIYESYYLPSSFANGGQKRIYTGIKVPFNLKCFNEILENSYFTNSNGRKSKINRLAWEIDSDYAEIDYEEEFNYTNKLTERLI